MYTYISYVRLSLTRSTFSETLRSSRFINGSNIAATSSIVITPPTWAASWLNYYSATEIDFRRPFLFQSSPFRLRFLHLLPDR